MPIRLQLSRRKGFDLQAASMAANGLPAVVVARPSKWGNPFTKSAAVDSGFANEASWRPFVVECFNDWIGEGQQGRDWWQGQESDARKARIKEGLPELRGKNLACWCAIGSPCHADALLELANMPACEAIP